MQNKADTDFTLAWVPGFMHFYPHNAPTLADDGTRMALGDRIIEFLHKHLKQKQVSFVPPPTREGEWQHD